MKVAELRIGNYVYAEVGLPSLQIHQVQVGDFIHIYSDRVHVEPIPLTENLLLKFGAISDEPSTPFFIVKLPRNIGEIRVNPDNNMTWLRHWSQPIGLMNPESLVYVHQLQNLYLALSGEELCLEA